MTRFANSPVGAMDSRRVRATLALALAALGILSLDPGNARAEVLRVPAAYPTIQAAIDAAAPTGDIVRVQPGTYTEALLLVGKSLVLESDSTTTPVLLGGRSYRVSGILIRDCEDVTLDGWTIYDTRSSYNPSRLAATPAATEDLMGFSGQLMAIRVKNLHLRRCEFHAAHGEPGGEFFNPGGPGKIVRNGGNGQNALYFERCSRVVLESAYIRAGDGGGILNYTTYPVSPGDGGDGIRALDRTHLFRGDDVEILPGRGGHYLYLPVYSGASGLAVRLDSTSTLGRYPVSDTPSLFLAF